MGFGPVACDLYTDLANAKVIWAGQSVLELGAQDFVPEDFDISLLFSAFNVKAYYQPAGVWTSRAFHAMISCPYECVDLDRRYRSTRLDLNIASANDVGTFDIVTNHGTTEHVFNQMNCFQFMHNATKKNGTMIHIVPSNGYENHCFFLYTKLLFEDLSAANGYRIIKLYTVKDTSIVPGETGVLLVSALQKLNDKPFCIPQQGRYSGCI